MSLPPDRDPPSPPLPPWTAQDLPWESVSSIMQVCPFLHHSVASLSLPPFSCKSAPSCTIQLQVCPFHHSVASLPLLPPFSCKSAPSTIQLQVCPFFHHSVASLPLPPFSCKSAPSSTMQLQVCPFFHHAVASLPLLPPCSCKSAPSSTMQLQVCPFFHHAIASMPLNKIDQQLLSPLQPSRVTEWSVFGQWSLIGRRRTRFFFRTQNILLLQGMEINPSSMHRICFFFKRHILLLQDTKSSSSR